MAPRKQKKPTGWAKRVQDAKDAAGITYPEMAARLGVSVVTVRAWAYGKREPSTSAQRLIRLMEKGTI